MIAGILTALSTITAMIPGLSSLVQSISTAWFNAKVQITAARIGGDTAVARELVTSAAKDNATNVDRLKVLASSPLLLAIVVLFSLPWIILEWKVIVYDNVWAHWGLYTTDPVKGIIGDWGGTIIACIFGSTSTMAIGHMYFNRKNQ